MRTRILHGITAAAWAALFCLSLARAWAPAPAYAEPAPAPAKPPAVLLLDASEKNGALNLGGGNRLLVRKCGLAVNSAHQMAIFNANSTVQVLEGGIQVVGGAYSLGKASIEPRPKMQAPPVADPFAALVLPEAGDVVSAKQMFIPNDREWTLRPGVYVGGISAVGKAITLTLQPGVYFIRDGDVFLSGPQVQGKDVTLVFTGTKPGRLSFANDTRATLWGPREGPLKDIVVISQRKADEKPGSELSFNGAQVALAGIVYAPAARVGIFFHSQVAMCRLVCANLMLNTDAVLDVTGVNPSEVPVAPAGADKEKPHEPAAGVDKEKPQEPAAPKEGEPAKQ